MAWNSHQQKSSVVFFPHPSAASRPQQLAGLGGKKNHMSFVLTVRLLLVVVAHGMTMSKLSSRPPAMRNIEAEKKKNKKKDCALHSAVTRSGIIESKYRQLTRLGACMRAATALHPAQVGDGGV